MSIKSLLFCSITFYALLLSPPQMQNLNFREPNPVVNENNLIALTVVDSAGQPVSGVTFESGSPDIAAVDAQTGTVTGVQRGFATITARRGSDSISTFVTVARVENRNGATVPGDAKNDVGGRFYLSDPLGHVILRKDDFDKPAAVYGGQRGSNGKMDGPRRDARFAGPTAIAVDNSARGAVYIADTLNHCIRRIGFNDDQVATIIGTGASGVKDNNGVPFPQAVFNSPRGIAVDKGGDLVIADTDNHAIYIADLMRQTLRLLAGNPGMSGKTDDKGKKALFFRPAGIAVKKDGKIFAVADTGNNRVRLITRDGDVSTISSRTSVSSLSLTDNSTINQTSDEIEFDSPQSVSFDDLGNIYVVERLDVRIITNLSKGAVQVVSLAQPGTIRGPSGIFVDGTNVFILDAMEENDNKAVKRVTVGAPEITSLSRTFDRIEGGADVVIAGKNFAPDSVVTLGDSVVNANIESATRISFKTPAQNAPGSRTLSVRTRGGVAQRKFDIIAKRFEELADGEITTIAGGVPFLGDGGMAVSAALSVPSSVAIDAEGNVFIADPLNNRIRRVDRTGVITSVAGNGTAGFSGDNGPALSASLDQPRGVAFDGEGNLFIADTKNSRIRRVDRTTSFITTVAGNGLRGFNGDNIPATNAALSFPTAIAISEAGDLFIYDRTNNLIRRVNVSGIISTVAGNRMFMFNGDNIPAVNASLGLSLEFFGGLAVRGNDLFIADPGNTRIRKVDLSTGIISTVAGNGRFGFGGDGGLAVSAQLSATFGVTVDAMGNLFIADSFNGRIRRVDAATGIIATVAGNGCNPQSRQCPNNDGMPALEASMRLPTSVATDAVGNLYIADSFNNRVRMVNGSTKIISTMAGSDISIGDNASATDARLAAPQGIALDRSGNIFITDAGNSRIRRVDRTTGIITTVAGNGNIGFSGDNVLAASASLSLSNSNFFGGIAVDDAGNLFIADTGNSRIRRVDSATGVITTVAGNGRFDFTGDNGPAVNAALRSPEGVAVDEAGNLFIADTGNRRIRRVDKATGIISAITGNSVFEGAEGIHLDGAGNLFFAEAFVGRIQRIELATNAVTVVAGNGRFGFGGDGGPATSATLNFPTDAAIDKTGNFFIADFLNNRIRRVDRATGIIMTVVGNGAPGYRGDGGPAATAGLTTPEAAAIDAEGNLFIADTFNNAVRVVKGAVRMQPPQVTISNAIFTKPNLAISGMGFGASGAKVSVNDQDVSARIASQTNTSIILKGNKKKLNLKKGSNRITVTVNGVVSNAFMLQL